MKQLLLKRFFSYLLVHYVDKNDVQVLSLVYTLCVQNQNSPKVIMFIVNDELNFTTEVSFSGTCTIRKNN